MPIPKPKKIKVPNIDLKTTPKVAPVLTKSAKSAALAARIDTKKKKVTEKTKALKGALKQNMTLETFAQGIDNVKKLREKIKNAPIALIEQIEDKWPGLTLAAFTTHLKDTDKLNLKEWSSDTIYSKFKPNTPFTIDFLGNNAAELKWGWADMASIEWRGMTKYQGGNKNAKRVSKRRIGLKGQNKPKRGCYDRRGYLAIRSKDQVMYHDVQTKFKTEFREKVGDKYTEINTKSYAKYSKSTYAKKDVKYFETNKKKSSFITRRPTITPQFIREIRAKIGSLEGLTAPQRVAKVARYLAIPENNIGGRHCGDWVDRVYAIAGVKGKQHIHHSLHYAFVDGNTKKGWLPKKNPDGSWNQKRYDVRTHGPRAYASEAKLDGLQAGDWVWINNRNKYDYAGNHSGVFLGWKDKKKRIATIACWFGNKQGRQKVTTYNFRNTPLVHISRPAGIDDSLPLQDAPNVSSAVASKKPAAKPSEGQYVYREVPGVSESGRRADWDPPYQGSSESATKTAYLKAATKMAKRVCAGTQLNWRIVLAQSILETGWGTSKNAKGMKNYFGIMAHELGPKRKQRDRAYKSMYESFMDYRNKMLTNSRYKAALNYKNNPLMAMAIIIANGYCLTPGYFRKIVGVLKATKYGPAIGLAGGSLDESELRNVLASSTSNEANDGFINSEFLPPARSAGKYQA